MTRTRNILWIVTTQWRAQACGYSGDVNAWTPELDALAARAMNFVQATTPHPFGPFARAALLTGEESPRNGVAGYFDPLPSRARTVAHALADRGYRTGFFGKWHLSRRDPAAPLVGVEHARIVVPLEHRGGFEHWEGFESGFQLREPWLHGTGLPEPVRFEGYQSDVLTARAGDWMTAQTRSEGGDRAPWFCVLSLEPPHPPYAGAPDVAGARVPSAAALVLRENVPLAEEIAGRARNELAGYYGHIAATDAALGRLLKRIDLLATTVVFTSVHGDMHGAHGLFRKGWPHEESVRVPLLIALPRGLHAGERSEPVSLADLPAMTLALAEGRDPLSASPAAQTGLARISMPSVVRLPHQCDRVWHGWRSPSRKWIFNQDGSPWLFFDLEKDPLELNNRVNEPDARAEFDRIRKLTASLA